MRIRAALSKNFKDIKKTFTSDIISGSTVALVGIPDGMAQALIANVNPIYGLYSGMINTVIGSFTSSSRLMIVSLTNALALVTGSALLDLSGEVKIEALFTLTLLVGLIQLILGLFRLGGMKRFVSDSVMTGFISAAALLIILGQLKHLFGIEPAGKSIVEKTYGLFSNMGDTNLLTLLIGVGTIVTIILLKRSRLKKFSDILGIVIGSIAVLIIGSSQVALIGDISKIPNSLPAFTLPNINLIPRLIPSAIAIALLGLTQSAGISTAFPNPDGSRSDPSKDFNSQGLANIAGSFFQAMPSGGSLSSTTIDVIGGAKSRWAGVYAGIILATIVAIAGSQAEIIPLTSLAGLLIVAGSLVLINKWPQMVQIWHVSKLSALAMIVTFLVAITVSLEVAIYTGILLSLILYMLTSAINFQLSSLLPIEEDKFEERHSPEKLQKDKVTILQIRGNFYFASVFGLEEKLPRIDDCSNAVVIIRLRGRSSISNTFLNLLKKYNGELRSAGNKLMLTGVSEVVNEQLTKTGFIDEIGKENIQMSTPRLQESMLISLASAKKWVEKKRNSSSNDDVA